MFRWATASLMHKEDSVTPGAWRLPDKPSGTFETQRAGVLRQVCSSLSISKREDRILIGCVTDPPRWEPGCQRGFYLREEVRHDRVIQDGALGPLHQPVPVGPGGATTAVPVGKVKPAEPEHTRTVTIIYIYSARQMSLNSGAVPINELIVATVVRVIHHKHHR